MEAEVDAVVQRLAEAMRGVIQAGHQMREDVAGETVQLAVAIAARILHRELSVDPDAILGLVRAALQKAQGKQVHRIRLHPSHEVLMRRALAQLNAGGTIEIAPDAGLRPGDVIFETAQGQLDASVLTQLREIERGLADRVPL
jgi:flagellar assembly protein FliH